MEKQQVGRPKKPKTVTPGLRIDAELWALFTSKHPRQANKLFKEWILKETTK